MKAYFTGSIVGKRHHLKNYLSIIETLKKQGIDVQSDHIINTTEDELSKVSKSERLKFQETLQNWINSADFMIAETTFPSISVGFEISLAVTRNKPVLMLYSSGEPPSLLAHFHSDRVSPEKYTPQSLDTIIEDFIAYVEGAEDTRFTFFVSSEIMAYLDKISKQGKIPKSVYLRNLIKEDMTSRGSKF